MVYLQNKTALLLLFFRDSDTIFCSFIIHSTSSATGKREDILGILLALLFATCVRWFGSLFG